MPKLIHCRACHLKWFPKGEPAGACPACGGKDLAGTLELFHVGIVLMVLAAIAWVVPSMLSSSGNERPSAAAAIASMVETKRLVPEALRTHAADLQRAHPADLQRAQAADVQRAHASDAQRAHSGDAQRTAAAAAPVSAIVKAKKLTLRVQRGPRKGHTVTLRRGERVTILSSKDRRYLVRDRRGNQVYVTSDKLNLRQTAEKGRQYVQR